MPTIEQYHAFHSMLCSPRTAWECCESFTRGGGCVMFLPSAPDSSRTEGELSRGNFSARLGLVSYYALVVFTLTGLSTLLGLTDAVERREVGREEEGALLPGPGDAPTPRFGSARDPAVVATPAILDYVRRRGGETDGKSQMRLIRRFEYDFRPVGLSVIMLHILSSGDDEGGDVLHLVEVYRFRSPAVRWVVGTAMSTLSAMWPVGRCVQVGAGRGKKAR